MEGTRPLSPLLTTKAMVYVRVCMGLGTSDVSLSKPLGWLKSEVSLPTLFLDGEIMLSFNHIIPKNSFSLDFGHFVWKKYTKDTCFAKIMKNDKAT